MAATYSPKISGRPCGPCPGRSNSLPDRAVVTTRHQRSAGRQGVRGGNPQALRFFALRCKDIIFMAVHPLFAGRSATLASRLVADVREALFERRYRPGDFLGTEKDLAAR